MWTLETRKLFFVLSLTPLLLLTIMVEINANPVVVEDKGVRYEEYIVEHEISESQARNSALFIDPAKVMSPPGCDECTKDEIKYCLGSDLINDHCCCDKRYHEYFPFVPHTCYFGTQICKTIVKDCDLYSRLRTCCCQKLVLKKWRKKAAASSGIPLKTYNLFQIIPILLFYLFREFFVIDVLED